jgi:putative transposase
MWQDRFKSNIIDTDIYLLQCGKYIELNPLRAGLVTSPEIRKKHFREFVLDQKVVCHDSFANHLFLGNPDFIGRMEKFYNVTNSKKKRGRPI